MIRVTKPLEPPEILTKGGAERTRSDREEFERVVAKYLSGELKLEKADNSIYGDTTVKTTLMIAQKSKCCYCERNRDQVELDIEHFRPKGKVKQSRSDRASMYPGYYWLAYDWTNLFLSCKGCNTSWKQVYFPLLNSGERSRSHIDANTV